MKNTAILLINCPDRKGIVLAIASFLYEHGANILHSDEHQDNELGLFFMRVEWALKDFDLNPASFREKFAPLASQFSMTWQVEYCDRTFIVAIFVSNHLHCLADLLYRHQTGELNCEIGLIISNHQDAAPLAKYYGVPFHHLPKTAETKAAIEAKELALLARHSVDLIVLARYMQILSAAFLAGYPRKIINVHHSFLPAFTGAKPYHAAFARGVKLIGSTSHYVPTSWTKGPSSNRMSPGSPTGTK
jgi:formyltetrahydrofolate deformylase